MTDMAHILIAEDESRLAAFIAKGLSARGYETTTVGDGAAAAGAARDGDVDLMILDLGLPELDGGDVLKQMRERGERLPVIIITARDVAEVQGADELVRKPFQFADLLASVQEHLAQVR